MRLRGVQNFILDRWEKYALVNGDKDKKTILFQKFKHVCRFILEAGRWVKVSWGKDVKQSYQTSLDIYAKDRIDLVLDVSAVLSSTQTRVAGLNAKTTADGFALIHLEIFVADSEQLSAVMRRLHQISGVMKVDRPAG